VPTFQPIHTVGSLNDSRLVGDGQNRELSSKLLERPADRSLAVGIERAGDFVQDQQHAVAVADLAHRPEVAGHRDQHAGGRAADRLGPSAAQVKQNLGRHDRLALLKLAALFHDSGKPAARAVAPVSGRVTFHGHAKAGSAVAGQVSDRLKLSARDREYFANLAGNHMHAIDLSQPQVKLKTLLRWFRRLGDDMVPLIVLSMADTQATLGPASSPAERERHLRWARDTLSLYYATIREQLASQPLIDGRDLLEMGVPPGPVLGRILRTVREAQDEKLVETRAEALKLSESILAGLAAPGR